VRDGKIVTSAGVSAGIDMALYITKELYGTSVCEDVARDIEYPLRNVCDFATYIFLHPEPSAYKPVCLLGYRFGK